MSTGVFAKYPIVKTILALAPWFGVAAGPYDQAAKLEIVDHVPIELKAVWEPVTDTVYDFEKKFDVIKRLKPVSERARYEARHFRPFLPTEQVGVGDVWRVDPKAALPFLRQFHPGATDKLHHGFVGVRGAWACLRALDVNHAEIIIRVHAEFLLEGDGGHGTSSWMTPAQFEGRMQIDRKTRAVTAFQLSLPQQRANVDFNVAKDGGTLADIGRIPRMELSSGDGFSNQVASGTEALTLEQARKLLARKFYQFAEVDWLNLEEALRMSKRTGKPMHIVALFGSLSDESC